MYTINFKTDILYMNFYVKIPAKSDFDQVIAFLHRCLVRGLKQISSLFTEVYTDYMYVSILSGCPNQQIISNAMNEWAFRIMKLNLNVLFDPLFLCIDLVKIMMNNFSIFVAEIWLDWTFYAYFC